MRPLVRLGSLALLFAAGCCNPGTGSTTYTPLDLSVAVTCAASVEPKASCRFGVDHSCRAASGAQCVCQCAGFWTCDGTALACDPDAGPLGD